jgi:endoglucanase
MKEIKQVFVPPDIEIQKILSKGINFEHIFIPYKKGDQVLKPEEWISIKNNLKEMEFKQVADLGFTHVRLNLGRGFIQNLNPPYPLLPEGLALLDQAVQMALKNNLGIVLDMHQTPSPDIFHDSQAFEAYLVLWRTLAAHYARQPVSVVFELMNEPFFPELAKPEPEPKDLDHWRMIMRDLIVAIHKEEPNRYIIVSGGGPGGDRDLMQMGNLNLPRLIYSFHEYQPFIFTHQGAGWPKPPLSGIKDIHYPLPESEVNKVRAEVKQTDNDNWPYHTYPHGFNRGDMSRKIQVTSTFAKNEKLLLYCGEFGVHKPYAPPEDRARWIADMVGLFKENNISWAMWAYHAHFDLVDEKGDPEPLLVEALSLLPAG